MYDATLEMELNQKIIYEVQKRSHANTYHIAVAQIDRWIVIPIETIGILCGQLNEIVDQRRLIVTAFDKNEMIVEEIRRFV